MNCQKCNSDRVLEIMAHAKDMHSYTFKGEEVSGSYACDFSSGGDDTEIAVCLECGQAQGEFPTISVLFECCGECGEPENQGDHTLCKED
jgi:hypothetical protein